MQALVYRRSVPLYLLGRMLGKMLPRRFFPRFAPLSLKEIPSPRDIDGWVTIKTRLCGICGSDLRLLRGEESYLLEPYASFPAVLGHEIAGEIVSAPGQSEWRPGDRVAVEPVLACAQRGVGPCRYCAEGSYNLCENFTSGNLAPGPIIGYNRSAGGGMGQFLLAHPERLVRIPATVPDRKAVLADSLASALQPVLEHFPGDDDTVIVFGAGIIGQHVIRSLRALGSRARLIVAARHPFQRELAERGGADVILGGITRTELAGALGATPMPTTLGGGNIEGGADMVFDCIGSTRSFQEALLALRAGGTYVMVGTAGMLGRIDFSSLWFRRLTLTGTSCYAHATFKGTKVRTYQLAMDLLAGDNYPTDGLLTHVYPLSAYTDAFKTAFNKAANKSVKVAIDPGSV